ncbi:hypothetical protein BBSC_1755 [Bifidobacterium scardovii JCM 12489 = DSM 13734]|nr:hypothetical protein BBSC_1755 [Bifidobacterium scardovii JCM 12489 = DSM 13734]
MPIARPSRACAPGRSAGIPARLPARLGRWPAIRRGLAGVPRGSSRRPLLRHICRFPGMRHRASGLAVVGIPRVAARAFGPACLTHGGCA